MRGWVICLLAMALLAACSAPADPSSGGPLDGASQPDQAGQLIQAELPRITSPDATAEQTRELVQGNNAFAVDLYHTITGDTTDNLIFSPYSISLAFSMVYAGARGETETHMAQVLGYLPHPVQHAAFNALDQRLSSLGGQSGEAGGSGDAFRLDIANAVWGQQGVPFKQAYLETLAQQYGAGLRVVDFAQAAEEARRAINGWVAEQTEERIKDLMPRGSIRANTRFVLANAIYFKASWLFPFQESATQDGPFTLLDGSQVRVPLMHNDAARVLYAEGDGYQAALLPYLGRTVEMVLLVPEAGRFAAIEQQLSADFLAQIRRQAEERDVVLTMPRFDFESSLDLKQLLSSMGMENPFSGAADFSGMVEDGGLFISDALHRATITVDEQGTEAAAATGIGMAESALQSAELTVDRPFIIAIVERDMGSILFLGRVLNPASS